MSQCCGETVYKGKCVRGRQVEVIDCVACGFKHLHPRTSQKELAAYYERNYFSTEKPDYAATSGTASEYQRLVDIDKFKAAHKDGVPDILDYGCGPNAPFLQNLRWHGALFDGYGYEPSQKEADRRWQLCGSVTDVICCVNSLKPWFDRGTTFDIVHMGFVLEHVANPFEELLAAKRLLKPGGRLVIEVPNDFSPIQMQLWEKLDGVPWWVSSPDHQNYWDDNSLERVLGRCGFSVIDRMATTYPVELFLAHGADYRKDKAAQQQVVALRADLQRIWSLCRPGTTQLGRTIWMVVKKGIA